MINLVGIYVNVLNKLGKIIKFPQNGRRTEENFLNWVLLIYEPLLIIERKLSHTHTQVRGHTKLIN